jgi:hypothetical protein
MKFSVWLIPLMLVLLASLTGCGGSGGSHSTAPPMTGLAAFTVQWPAAPAAVPAQAKPHLIPAASSSIVVNILNGTTVLQSFTFVRPTPSPTGYPAQTHQFTGLPVQTLTVTATAYPTMDGHGVAQAAAAQPLALTAQNPTSSVTLKLLSTITSLTLQPGGPLTLFSGQSQQLFAVPKDATGATVLTAASTITWSSSDAAGQFLTLNAATGLLKAVKATPGASPVTVTTTYTDQDVPASLTASAAITVNPAPAGGAPNVAAYVNRNGLAIGPSGIGPGKFQQLADVALGSFYAADPGNVGFGTGFEVQKFKQNSNGSLTLDTTFNPAATYVDGSGVTQSAAGTISVPGASSVAVNPADDSVYVIGISGAVLKFSSVGVGGAFLPNVANAVDLAADPAGNLIVAESLGSATQVEVYNSAGVLLTTPAISTTGLQAGTPAGVTVDSGDNIYVLVGTALVKLKPNTPGNPGSGYTQDASFGTGGVTISLASAAHVAVDTRQGLVTTGNLYVTVPSSNVIEVFDNNGADSGSLPISQSASVNLGTPSGITIDNRVNVPTSGFIYVGNTAPAGTVSQAVQVLAPGP